MEVDVRKIPKTWDKEADVVVIGFGAAGATTAITAHDEGAKVLIIEKNPPDTPNEIRRTLNTRMSGGFIFTPKTADGGYKYQKRMNELYRGSDVSDKMLRTWAEYASQNWYWIKRLKGSDIFALKKGGFTEDVLEGRADFASEFAEWPEAECVQWVWNPYLGYGVFKVLSENVYDRGIEIMLDTKARELVQNAKREVIGVIAEKDGKDVCIRARRAVVLCCGGFEYNMEMQLSFLRVYPFHFYGNPNNTGDSIKMALKAGAALWHMNNISGRATAWFPDYRIAFTVRPDLHAARSLRGIKDRFERPIFHEPAYSWILVDKHGRRFCNEIYKMHTFYWETVRFDAERVEFPIIPCHMIFDENTRRKAPIAAPFGASGPIKPYEWSEDNGAEIERGWIRKADSLRGLAMKIGCNPNILEETVKKYNEYCKKGKDPEFNRPSETLKLVEKAPFYECIQWPGGPNTQGDPKRNENAQVLDPDDKPIPRLYSAGEMGSIYGFFYEAGGNLCECIAFGSIAGKNAAAEKPLN